MQVRSEAPGPRHIRRRQLLAGLTLLAIPGGSTTGEWDTFVHPPQAAAPNPEDGAPHWDYDAEGPEHWAELDYRYLACARGSKQSPIDLPSATLLDSADRIGIDFGRLPAVGLTNTGHTLQADPPAANACRILVGGQRFRLVQFHFHAPSEHTVDGRGTAMEVHLVHRNTVGAVAVLAVLMRPEPGPSAFDPVLTDIPHSSGATVMAGRSISGGSCPRISLSSGTRGR
ncbi:carbonic anhydrase family protein [Nocardia thraciensis]